MARALDGSHGELDGFLLAPILSEDEWEDDIPEPRSGHDHDTRGRRLVDPERQVVDMPSSRWKTANDLENLTARQRRALRIEFRLRMVHLDEILYLIRQGLVDQAHTYRSEIRSSAAHPSYLKDKKARSKARTQGKEVRVLAQIYAVSRERTMAVCPADELELLAKRYKVLTGDDIRCDTATYAPTSSDRFELPWIWKMNRRADETDDEYLSKCESRLYLYLGIEEMVERSIVFRTRWIEAKSTLQRCKEEIIILEAEMIRCILGCRYRAATWGSRASCARDLSPGHQAFAQKRRYVWKDLGARAVEIFAQFGVGLP
ncbi:unnamed protein product [Peniophora sp. CBMAI 1063]|nr:unnamed protein product [Peniophora sp. CBMAI 1063]